MGGWGGGAVYPIAKWNFPLIHWTVGNYFYSKLAAENLSLELVKDLYSGLFS